MIHTQRHLYYSFFLVLLTIFSCSVAMDDLDMDEEEKEFELLFETEEIPNVVITRTPQDSLQQIRDLNISTVFGEELYKKTYPLNKRSLHTMPSFFALHTNHLTTYHNLSLKPFFTRTPNLVFANDSIFMKEYVDLSLEDFLEHIDDDLLTTFQLPIEGILNALSPAKGQEHRAGVYAQWITNWRKFTISASLPLYYQERNFFFTETERNALEKATQELTGTEQQNDPANERQVRKFVVSDRLGLGNLYLYASITPIRCAYLDWNIGFTLELPTALTFAEGLIGGSYKNSLKRPSLDLDFIIRNRSAKDKLTEIGKEYFEEAIKRLNTILLDSDLGNDRHPVIGCLSEFNYHMDENASCFARLALHYKLPRRRIRFFRQDRLEGDFTNSNFTIDSSLSESEKNQRAKDHLDFLSVQGVNAVFPNRATAKVHPGWEVQATFGQHFTGGNILLDYGIDIWHKSKEQLSGVTSLKVPTYPLDIENGRQPAATQAAIFCGLEYKKIDPGHAWTFAIKGNYVVAAKNIGRERVTTVSVSYDF